MSILKIPSWLELLRPTSRVTLPSTHSQESFWKEQTLRFGFDPRKKEDFCTAHTLPWKNFFFERLFEYTLKKANWQVANLKTWEKRFWQENGSFIERLMLQAQALSAQDLSLLLEWLPNLKMLHLEKCNQLFQQKTLQETPNCLAPLAMLHTLEIVDIHLVSTNVLQYIPEGIQSLLFKRCRSFCPELFDKIATLPKLTSLTIRSCPSLEFTHLGKLPTQLLELDLSASGRTLQEDSLALLPRSLKSLKLNRYEACSDKELNYLPRGLHTLELEGWNLSPKGFEQLVDLPLLHLNAASCGCEDFYSAMSSVPKTLQSLNLSQNCLTVKDFTAIVEFRQLQKLQIEYAQAFGSQLADEGIDFPEKLKELNLGYSGPFAKKTLQHLKRLKNLKKLSLAGCDIENSDLQWLPEGIEELHLSLCSQLTDYGITLLKNHPRLTSLTLDGCEQIRGSCLSAFSPLLKALSLQGCNRLSGKSFTTLPDTLEQLLLDHCSLITSEDLNSLPSSLQVLSLSGCPYITNEAVDFFMDLPLLHTISLQGCPAITEEMKEKFTRRKFEGTIMMQDAYELHPPVSVLKKLTNFKARLIERFTKC